MVHDQRHVAAVGMVELRREVQVGFGQIAVGAVLPVNVRMGRQMTEPDGIDEDEPQTITDVEAVRAGAARRRHARNARRVTLEELALGQSTIPALGTLYVPVVIAENEHRTPRRRGIDLGPEDSFATGAMLVSLRRKPVPVDVVAEVGDHDTLRPERPRARADVRVQRDQHRLLQLDGALGRQLRRAGVADEIGGMRYRRIGGARLRCDRRTDHRDDGARTAQDRPADGHSKYGHHDEHGTLELAPQAERHRGASSNQ
jgi:hypothetical protein